MKKNKASKAVKVAICDSNPEQRALLYDFCKSIKEKYSIPIKLKEYENGEALLFDMEDTKIMSSVDIILLETDISGQSGIELAKDLRERDFTGAVIFVTYCDNRWRCAFDVKAFNYVTKDQDLIQRFERVFLSAVKDAQEQRSKALIFSSIDETRRIEVNTISHFEIRNHLVTIYYGKDQIFEFVSSLSKIESLLIDDGFLRVHRSFLVSVPHVASFLLGKKTIVMVNGMKIPVGRKYSAEVRAVLENKPKI